MAFIQARVEKVGAAIARFAIWLVQRETLGPMPPGAGASTQVARISPLRWLFANEDLPNDGPLAEPTQTRKNCLARLFQREELGMEEVADVSGNFFRNLLERESLASDEPRDTAVAGPRSYFGYLMEREVLGQDEAAEAGSSHKRAFFNGVFEAETLDMSTQAPEKGPRPVPILGYILQQEPLGEEPVCENASVAFSFLRMVFGREHLGSADDSPSFNMHDKT